MDALITRPVVVIGIVLAAAGYAATKEWQWQEESLPIVPVAQVERVEDSRAAIQWQGDAVTAEPDQIFQD
ncbi:MAG: hypothetical protein WEG40_05640 [Candidatus Rokuibacteriota bacterium]